MVALDVPYISEVCSRCFWAEAPTEVVATILRQLDLVTRTCSAPFVCTHWRAVAAQLAPQEDEAIAAEIQRRRSAHYAARAPLSQAQRHELDRQFAARLATLFQEHAVAGDANAGVRLMDDAFDSAPPPSPLKPRCEFANRALHADGPWGRRKGRAFSRRLDELSAEAARRQGLDVVVEATLAELCALLDRGATPDACQRFRPYLPPNDCDCDETEEAGNVAALFVSAVLSLDMKRPRVWRQRRFEQLEALFLRLVSTTWGGQQFDSEVHSALRTNFFGVFVSYYHNFEMLQGNVLSLCTSVLGRGVLCKQVHRTGALRAAATYVFAARVLQLQTLADRTLRQQPHVQSHQHIPRVHRLHPHTCRDFFYGTPLIDLFVREMGGATRNGTVLNSISGSQLWRTAAQRMIGLECGQGSQLGGRLELFQWQLAAFMRQWLLFPLNRPQRLNSRGLYICPATLLPWVESELCQLAELARTPAPEPEPEPEPEPADDGRLVVAGGELSSLQVNLALTKILTLHMDTLRAACPSCDDWYSQSPLQVFTAGGVDVIKDDEASPATFDEWARNLPRIPELFGKLDRLCAAIRHSIGACGDRGDPHGDTHGNLALPPPAAPTRAPVSSDIVWSLHLLPWFAQRPSSSPSAQCFSDMSDTHQDALLLLAPSLPFMLVKRRNRHALEMFLARSSGVIGSLRFDATLGRAYSVKGEVSGGKAEFSTPSVVVDLLTFACGQRGLTHRIVQSMITSGLFVACGGNEDADTAGGAAGGASPVEVARSRAAALACAQSVRNCKTVAVLLEAFPELN